MCLGCRTPRATGSGSLRAMTTCFRGPAGSRSTAATSDQCSTWNIAGYQSGDFAGRPTRRGQRSPGSPCAIILTAPAVPDRTPTAGPRPRVWRPSSGHRAAKSEVPSGGSVTTRLAPARRNPTAHSAVTAGRPNERATTRSNVPRSSGARARSSARPQVTRRRPSSPSVATASSRKLQRRCCESSSTPRRRASRARARGPGLHHRNQGRGRFRRTRQWRRRDPGCARDDVRPARDRGTHVAARPRAPRPGAGPGRLRSGALAVR